MKSLPVKLDKTNEKDIKNIDFLILEAFDNDCRKSLSKIFLGVFLKPNEYVRDLVPYLPGKPVEELERELGITGAIKLASNENPLGPSPKVRYQLGILTLPILHDVNSIRLKF